MRCKWVITGKIQCYKAESCVVPCDEFFKTFPLEGKILPLLKRFLHSQLMTCVKATAALCVVCLALAMGYLYLARAELVPFLAIHFAVAVAIPPLLGYTIRKMTSINVRSTLAFYNEVMEEVYNWQAGIPSKVRRTLGEELTSR